MALVGFSIRFFGYCLYGLVLMAVLLYVRFPAEKFISFCETRLAQTFPGSQWKINKSAYAPPFTALFGEVRVSGTDPENGGLLFTDVRISIPSVLAPRHWGIEADGYGGELKGELVWLPQGKFELQKLDLHDVGMAPLFSDLKLDKREIGGTLAVAGSYSGDCSQPLKGAGKATVKAEAGMVGLIQPILGLEQLQFDSVAAAVDFGDGVMKITGGALQGTQLIGKFDGDITASWPVPESMLTVSGQLGVNESFWQERPQEKRLIEQLQRRFGMKTLPFYMGGSLGSPTFGFGR